jgi:hypothetical protein
MADIYTDTDIQDKMQRGQPMSNGYLGPSSRLLQVYVFIFKEQRPLDSFLRWARISRSPLGV